MICPLETHEEDWYWCNPGEVMIEAEFLQDLTDDGLFQKPPKEEMVSEPEDEVGRV